MKKKDLTENKRKKFCKKLLGWRKKNNFDSSFPWRNSRNKYKILLSEILLKKTTRVQVANEWSNIIRVIPTIKALQKADRRMLVKVLTPLGMENVRAEHLKQLGEKISEEFNGRVPSSKKELLEMPGVGPYTANAVLCFAFKKDVSMVDVNILRVLQRVFSLKSKSSRMHQDKKIWEFAESLPPKGRGKDFNYGILDFAAKVCTARKPKCGTCVMKKICGYYSKSI